MGEVWPSSELKLKLIACESEPLRGVWDSLGEPGPMSGDCVNEFCIEIEGRMGVAPGGDDIGWRPKGGDWKRLLGVVERVNELLDCINDPPIRAELETLEPGMLTPVKDRLSTCCISGCCSVEKFVIGTAGGPAAVRSVWDAVSEEEDSCDRALSLLRL